MSEERAVSIYEAGAVAVRQSPMDALAAMSEQEFGQRLTQMKLAQQRMAKIQREMMEPDVDFGVIPGTGNKPTLLKPGAEKLCLFSRLVPTFANVTTLGDGQATPHIRVQSTCTLHHGSEEGPVLAQGAGAANSWEKKYRWRDAQRLCPLCQQPTIFKSKPEKGGGFFCWSKKGGCGAEFRADDPAITEQVQGRAENPDPFDVENTLVKMAAKRAYIDATLRATGTSGLFSQDLEDIATEPQQPVQAQQNQRPAEQRTQPRPTTPKDPKRDELMGKWADLWNGCVDLKIKPSVLIAMGDTNEIIEAKLETLAAEFNAANAASRAQVAQ